MKLENLTFVTSNKAKAIEIQRILDIPIVVEPTEIEEIQELDLEKVATHKLLVAYSKFKKPLIVDDVSVELEAWNSFPGPLIKWLLQSGGGDASTLLKMLGEEENRRCVAKLAIGFHDGETPRIFFGEVSGRIAKEITGENGFGWDPVFIPDGFDETFAQMDPKDKDLISHRGLALQKFKDFIKANYDI